MNAKVHRMSYAANIGLSRLHCRRCAEETLHKGDKCIHCGMTYEAVQPTQVKLSAKEVMALETLARNRRRQQKVKAQR